VAPKAGDWPIVIIEQEETAKTAFNAVNGTINSITTIVVYYYYKLNFYGDAARE
jgi:riboflavin transporter FmnP